MRTNARAVFLCSVLALLLVSAWWLWKLSAPVEKRVRVSRPAATSRPRPDLGLLAFLEAQLAMSSPEIPESPFLFPGAKRPKKKPPSQPTKAKPEPQPKPAPAEKPPAAAAEPKKPAKDEPPQKAVAKPKPAPKKRPVVTSDPVRLTFRGFFKRTDGSTVALIEDSKTEESAFYAAEQDLYGVKIGAITRDHVTVELDDGSSVELGLGKPEIFDGGRHAR